MSETWPEILPVSLISQAVEGFCECRRKSVEIKLVGFESGEMGRGKVSEGDETSV